MKTVVFSSDGNAKSAVKLGYPVLSHSTYFAGDPPEHLIRWGRSDGMAPSSRTVEYNKAPFIAQAARKDLSLAVMKEAGISVPVIKQRGDRITRPTIVRPIYHAAGEDFTVCYSGTIPADHIGTEYVNSEKEYRVWFTRRPSGGYSSLVGKRIPLTDEDREMERREYKCRSKWGYSFLEELPSVMARTAIPVMEKSKLDFGAIDLLWEGEEARKYYFLEVNTAPALDHREVNDFFRSNFRVLTGDRR